MSLESIPVEATEDLSPNARQYKAVDMDGTISATFTGLTPSIGILQNKPESGEDMTVGWLGRSRYVAGAAVTAGNLLTVTTSGFMVTVTSGDGVCGRAMNAVSSGETGEGLFNFANGLLVA